MDNFKDFWNNVALQTKVVVGVALVGLVMFFVGVSSKPKLEDYTQIQKEALAVRKQVNDLSVKKELDKYKKSGVDVRKVESDAAAKTKSLFETAFGGIKDKTSYRQFEQTYKGYVADDFFEDVKSVVAESFEDGKFMALTNKGVQLGFGNPDLAAGQVPVFVRISYNDSTNYNFVRFYKLVYDFDQQRYTSWNNIQAKLTLSSQWEDKHDE